MACAAVASVGLLTDDAAAFEPIGSCCVCEVGWVEGNPVWLCPCTSSIGGFDCVISYEGCMQRGFCL